MDKLDFVEYYMNQIVVIEINTKRSDGGYKRFSARLIGIDTNTQDALFENSSGIRSITPISEIRLIKAVDKSGCY